MNTIGKISFKEIKRISPSQYYSMKNCAYKSLLAEAFDKKPLLPVSPNAYFGTVLHKMLELIAKGIVRSESDFNNMFDEQVGIIERSLQQQGFSFYIPLQKNVKDFGMKKVLLKKHLRASSGQNENPSSANFHSEKWLESKDKLIAGKVDLLVEKENETEIIDFKTGSVTEDVLDDAGDFFTEVKEEYKEQLKLYAYLYFENTGRFPARLSIVDLAKQEFKVEFSAPECHTIYEQAKKLLHSTNESIKEGVFQANPTETNCKYCLYRPACSFFLRYIDAQDAFNDVCGTVTNVTTYRNGNVSVFLQRNEKHAIITNFPFEMSDQLFARRNKRISIYNLRKEATEFVYSATKTTMIYE